MWRLISIMVLFFFECSLPLVVDHFALEIWTVRDCSSSGHLDRSRVWGLGLNVAYLTSI